MACLLIGEHGDYPYNAKGQKLYPRYEMFQKIVKVFQESNKVVPVFNDKHLSFDRKKAAEMVATSQKMKFPMLAGSSLPVTWRRPELELPLGVKIQEALVVSRGELEIMGIHALEALQCMVERRTSGQQGVKAVEYLEGDAVWKAADAGRWSWDLLEHALGRSPSRNVGDPRENCALYPLPITWGARVAGPRAFLIEYRDGLKATVLQLDGHVADDTFAARIEGMKKPVSTLFYLPPPPGAAFLEALAMHVEEFMASGKPPYPIERTLLTGGILDWALESRIQKKRLETNDLDVSYDPPKDSGYMRGDYVARRESAQNAFSLPLHLPFRTLGLLRHASRACHRSVEGRISRCRNELVHLRPEKAAWSAVPFHCIARHAMKSFMLPRSCFPIRGTSFLSTAARSSNGILSFYDRKKTISMCWGNRIISPSIFRLLWKRRHPIADTQLYST